MNDVFSVEVVHSLSRLSSDVHQFEHFVFRIQNVKMFVQRRPFAPERSEKAKVTGGVKTETIGVGSLGLDLFLTARRINGFWDQRTDRLPHKDARTHQKNHPLLHTALSLSPD